MKPHPIMEKALQHYNFEAAKKKATQEETWKPDIPPFPVYKSADGVVNNLGWRNFLRSLLKESKQVMKQLRP